MKRILRLCRWVLIATGALVLAVTFTPLVSWAALQLSEDWTDSDGDVLIVLTADMIGEPAEPSPLAIGPGTYWRVFYAARAWKAGQFRNLLVCGRGSDAARPILEARGVPAGAILLEDRSQSTRENAQFAKPLLAGIPGRFVLLTSDYHMFRAWRCFRREGIQIVTRPIPDVRKRANSLVWRWEGFWLVAEELLKIGWYKTQGWI